MHTHICVCMCVSSCYKDGEAKLPYICQTQLPSLSELVARIHFAVSLSLKIFRCGPCYFKVFIEFVIVLLLFYVLVFWLKSMWDLSTLIRDRTHTRCCGRRSLNQGTAGEGSAASLVVRWGRGLSDDS